MVRRPKLPSSVARRTAGPIPRPRLLGFAAGLVGALLLVLLSQLVFGGIEFRSASPRPAAFLEE